MGSMLVEVILTKDIFIPKEDLLVAYKVVDVSDPGSPKAVRSYFINFNWGTILH